MDDVYLDVGDPSSFEALLPAHHAQWGEGLPIEEYRLLLRERTDHDWAKHRVRSLVLRDPERNCLSTLRLYGVRAMHRGAVIRLGGIGEVLTPEPLRGRGHAGKLLRLTLDLLEQEGVDGAYLFSDIDPAFYARFGFATVCARRVDLPLDEIPGDGGGRCRVRPRHPGDWEAVRRLHTDAGAGEALWFLRDEDQWGYLIGRWPLWARHDPRYQIAGLDSIAERDGRVVGYAISLVEISERTLNLLEFGLASPDEEALPALLADLKQKARGMGCTRFMAPWPPGAIGARFRERFGSVPRREGILMVASLSSRFDPASLIGGDAGYWETDHV